MKVGLMVNPQRVSLLPEVKSGNSVGLYKIDGQQVKNSGGNERETAPISFLKHPILRKS